MNAHYLQHVPFEGPAHIAAVLEDLGVPLTGTRLYAGEPLPDPREKDLLVIMGGPMGVHDGDRFHWLASEMAFIAESIAAGKKVLGICLGAQLIAHVLGADVRLNRHKEIGWFPVKSVKEGRHIVAGAEWPERFNAFHWHGETFGIPAGAHRLASSEACENQAFIYDERVLALQFHLESTAESVDLLIEHAAEDLVPGPFVQDPRAMRERAHFAESNAFMARIVTAMLKGKR